MPAERLQPAALAASVEPADAALARTPPGESLRRFQERAVDLVTGPEAGARSTFDASRRPCAIADGRLPLGQNLLLARRLIEAGVRW